MAVRKYFDRSQPQTLQNAVVFCYLNAALSLLYAVIQRGDGLVLLVIILLAPAAWGIANDSKLGYFAAVGLSVLNLGLFIYVLVALRFAGFGFTALLDLAFAVLLVYLLLTQSSRSYARIWFRWKI